MLTIAPENGHQDAGDTRDGASQRLVRTCDAGPGPAPRAPVTFNNHERRALDLIGDDPQATIAIAADTATALVGSERDQARLLLIAKLLAAEEARLLHLTRLLDERTCCRDIEAVAMFDRAINSSTARICRLTAEHRACSSAGSRAAIVVGHAHTVNVKAGGQP